jgi:transcriptional regulator with XRE-family HTH domain
MDQISAEFLRSRRLELGKSVEQVAAEVGRSVNAVFTWESGRYVPATDSLPSLARSLECDLADLYEKRALA